MTKERLEEFLYSYNEFEATLRDYAIKNGTLMPKHEFPKELMLFFSIQPLDLRNLVENAETTPGDGRPMPKSFLEPGYFSPDLDIYIMKTLRYYHPSLTGNSFFTLCYQYRGKSQIELEVNSQRETLPLASGDFLFLPENLPHSEIVDPDGALLRIGIRSSTFTRAFSHNIPPDSILGVFFLTNLSAESETVPYLLFRTGDDPYVHEKVLELIDVYCSIRTLYSPNRMNLLLNYLFLYLLETHSSHSRYAAQSLLSGKFVPLMRYLEQHYAEASAADVAKRFGYSADYLNLIFKRQTGHTLGELILRLKMQKAAALLKSTALSVDEISALLGYQNPTNFIRSFKKYAGQTPLQYRKSQA